MIAGSSVAAEEPQVACLLLPLKEKKEKKGRLTPHSVRRRRPPLTPLPSSSSFLRLSTRSPSMDPEVPTRRWFGDFVGPVSSR